MLRLLTFAVLLCSTFISIGQTDSLEITASYDLPIQAFTKYPTLFGIQIENRFAHEKKFLTRNNQGVILPYEKGRQYSIFGTIPVLHTPNHWYGRIDASYDYRRDHYGVPLSRDFVISEDINLSGTFATLAAGVTKVVAFKNWKRRLIFSGRFSMSGRAFNHFNKYTGLLTANLLWKKTNRTSLSFGVTGVFRKNNRFPIFPNISWNQKLSPHWNLEMMLPLRAHLRYVQSAQASMTAGFRLGANSPFINNNLAVYQDFDQILQLHNLDVRFFASGEWAVNSFFWLHSELGYNRTFRAALTEFEPESKGLLLRGSSFGNIYLQVGIFLRPVYQPKK